MGHARLPVALLLLATLAAPVGAQSITELKKELLPKVKKAKAAMPPDA